MGAREAIKFTYEDYLHLPEEKRYEIIDGDLIMVPAPSISHQDISLNLAIILRKFVREKSLGVILCAPCDVILSEVDIVQPDILFISKERLNIITEDNIRGAPDLVIEIISKSSEYRDRVIKRKLYSKYGVKEYWIVDPEKKEIEVLELKESGLERVRSYGQREVMERGLIEGLKVDLKEVFGKILNSKS
jgi:Uma2 family endonuclease